MYWENNTKWTINQGSPTEFGMPTAYIIDKKNQLNTNECIGWFPDCFICQNFASLHDRQFSETFQEVAVIKRIDCACSRTQFKS